MHREVFHKILIALVMIALSIIADTIIFYVTDEPAAAGGPYVYILFRMIPGWIFLFASMYYFRKAYEANRTLKTVEEKGEMPQY